MKEKFWGWFLIGFGLVFGLFGCGGGGGGGELAENTITIFTGVEGFYVTRHDPQTLAPVETVKTDGTGVVTFTGISGSVPISLAGTPETVVPPEDLFVKMAKEVAFATNQGLCHSTCEEALNGTLPVTCIQAVIENDEFSCNASSGDANNDGYLDKTELYDLVLSCRDANKNGKIESGELESGVALNIGFILTVPPGDYDLTQVISEPEIFCWWWDNYTLPAKTVNWQVTNVPPEVRTIKVASRWIKDIWGRSSDNSTTTAAGSFDLDDRDLQSDGNYTLLFYDDQLNHLWLVDISSDNVTVDYGNFTRPAEIRLLNFPASGNNTWTWVDFWTSYKGIYWDLPTKDLGNGTLLTVTVPFGTTIKSTLHYEEDLSTSSTSRGERSYYADLAFSSLPSAIDFNQNMLNVDLTSSAEGSFTFSGDGLSEVNEMNYYFEKRVEICDNATSNCTEYKVWIDVSGYYPDSSVLSSGSWNPDWSQILPPEVYNYFRQVEQAFSQYQNANGTDEWFHEEFVLNAYPDVTSLNDWVQFGRQGMLWSLDKKGVGYSRSYDWWARGRASRSTPQPRLKPWQRSGWFKPSRIK